MDVSVRDHIAQLEARIKALAAELMEEKNVAKRNVMESEIRAAEMAVSHYRAALLLEGAFDKRRA
jgi:hypothetical protein